MHIPKQIAAILVLAMLLPAQDPDHQKLTADYEQARAKNADAAVAEFVPLFEAAAARHTGQEAAVPFLCWIVRHGGGGAAVGKALDQLRDAHAGSPAVGPAVDMVPHLACHLGDERCTALLDKVLAASPPPELQARALVAHAVIALQRGKDLDDAQRELAGQRLENAKKLTKDTVLAGAIANLTAEPRGLGIGEVIPEVAGIDLDGVPFRLSDYRGKVVVLDFWGDW